MESKRKTRGSLVKQSDSFCMAKTKCPEKEKKWQLNHVCGLKSLAKSLYGALFSRYKHFFVFLQFLQKIGKFEMAVIFGGTNFFENWVTYLGEFPCRSKISSKSLYLAQFLRYKYFVFCIFEIIQKGRHF